MDYLYKWPEAEPVKDESAHGVASFLFRMICRLFLQKGLQFSFLLTDMALLVASSVIKGVNHLNKELFHLTKMHHKISSAHHP